MTILKSGRAVNDELKRVKLSLPRWVPAVYIAVAIGLVPWIFMLSATLPQRHVSRHWDLAWVGFDLGMLLVLALTAYLAMRRSWWVCLTAMSTFTLLITDAWFDITTSRPGQQMLEAFLLAVGVEVPLAVMSLWLSYRVAKELVEK